MSVVIRGRGLVNFHGAAMFAPDGPPLADVLARYREREWMVAHDDRTPIQKWLGDPPLWRSAIGRHNRLQ